METTQKAPYVRGFVLLAQMGHHRLAGCTRCVRRRILREAGISSVAGWFSITALVINPFLIVYNVSQSFFVKARPHKVEKLLRDMGLPQESDEVDMAKAGYTLAVSMITADGKIEAEEVEIARRQGLLIFGRFDEEAFRRLLEEHTSLPPVADIAAMMGRNLSRQAKGQIIRYLKAIAMGDGEFAETEVQLLSEIANKMGYSGNELIGE